MTVCSRTITAYGTTARCRREEADLIHARPEPGCAWPDTHHPYQEEEPMPKPTVTIATVTDTYDPAPGSNQRPWYTLRVEKGDPVPRVGDRVAVAGSVDAIFGWMDSLHAKRVIDAARDWADYVAQYQGPEPRLQAQAAALYDAVRALGTPSEDEKPPERGTRVFIVNVGPEDEWLLHTGDRLILSPAGDVSVVIAQEAR